MAMPEGLVALEEGGDTLPVGARAAYLVLLRGEMTSVEGVLSPFLDGLLDFPGAMVRKKTVDELLM